MTLLKITWKPKTYYLPSAPSAIAELTDFVERILTKLECLDIQGITEGVKKTLNVVSKILEDANAKKLNGQAEELLLEFRKTNQLVSGSITGELPEILTTLRKTL
ncbi:MAG: hypothetical protein MRJ65_13665 [Candidatus Brocadiaceae bacterium]|nr:hypothetical protein [Candidatus Brocadiaceae bacterium]